MTQPTQMQKPDIHGHEILDMMAASGLTYSNASLSASIIETFGKDATFNTCSAAGMDAYEVVEHLWTKGKFSGTPQSFAFSPGSRCDH